MMVLTRHSFRIARDACVTASRGVRGVSMGRRSVVHERFGSFWASSSRPRVVSPAAAEPPLHFDRFPLDRAGDRRHDSRLMEEMTDSADSLVVVFVDGRPVVGPRGSAAVRTFARAKGGDSDHDGDGNGDSDHDGDGVDTLVDSEGDVVTLMPWVIPMGELKALAGTPGPGMVVFLGMCRDGPVFAANVRLEDIDEVRVLQEHGLETADARRVGPKLAAEDASVLANASGMLAWHRNAAFDPRTGKAASEIVLGGHGRRVPGEQRALYPRVDPAVIVSVEHGEWLLLGRKASWVPGRYSLLAGFVELAESLEDAACREVFEESGVAVSRGSLTYHSSQPWPFPRSLMVGFSGTSSEIERAPRGFDLLACREAQMAARGTGVLEDELNSLRASLTLPRVEVDEEEMEDVRWFHAKYLWRQLCDGDDSEGDAVEMRIPGKHAVASAIIHHRLDAILGSRRSELDVVPAADLGPKDLPGFGGARCEMKYVLLRVSTGSGDNFESRFIVRGDPRASYHNHVFTYAKAELRQFDLDVLGGGRIVVDDDARTMRVYGYSAAFGAAVHEISRAVLLEQYPLYSIETAYDGY